VLSILVGSEGTLAVFLRIRLRVLPVPEASAAAVATFDEVEAAAEAANEVLRAGILPAKLEFLDRRCITCVNAKEAGTFDEGAAAALMFEFDGSRDAVAAELEAAGAMAEKGGAYRPRWACSHLTKRTRTFACRVRK
jgi:glycolate oxidase